VNKSKEKDLLALSVEEAGKRLGLGRAASYAAVNRGQIPFKRVGKRLIVPLVQLERWLADNRPSLRRN
jgi:excisionase family DNA binding protein